LKTPVLAREILVVIAAAILLSSVVSGCGKEGPTESKQESTPLSIMDVIVQPKAPSPGEVVSFTVILSSTSQNAGDMPTYRWRTDCGRLLSDDRALVEWVAPDTSRICTITVTASNSVSSVEATRKVFVSDNSIVAPDGGGGIFVVPGDSSIYYLASPDPPGDVGFAGFTLNRITPGPPPSVVSVTTANPGIGYVFSNDFSFCAHVVETTVAGAIENPKDIVLTELPSGVQTRITQDSANPSNSRKDLHTHPTISPDGMLVVYQKRSADTKLPDSGGVDTLDLYLYDRIAMTTTRLTFDHNNLFPCFSSDGSYLFFVSDRDTTVGWEFFGFPVNNDVVDMSNLVQFTHTGGLITSGWPPSEPLEAVNPVSAHPLLAVLGADGVLRLIGTDGSVKSVSGITDPVSEMVWSVDGTKLAVSTGDALYSVGLDGAASLLWRFQEGDLIVGFTWSSDGDYIIYSLLRGGSTWFELLDVKGDLGLDEPLKISNAVQSSTIEGYRAVVSLSPGWASIDRVYVPVFDSNTPGIEIMNLSGLLR
jgi:hypothetical protein